MFIDKIRCTNTTLFYLEDHGIAEFILECSAAVIIIFSTTTQLISLYKLETCGGYMLAETIVVFYVWSTDVANAVSKPVLIIGFV